MKSFFSLISILTVCTAAYAMDIRSRDDQQVYAVDLTTGKIKWTHPMEGIGIAHFALYPEGLVAYTNYNGDDHSYPTFLNPSNGITIKPFSTAATLLAKSRTFHPPYEVCLSNGWRLVNFRPGDDTNLTFAADGKTVWKIETGCYPDTITCYEDIVYYADAYQPKEGEGAVVHAYRAGDVKPLWLFDANRLKGVNIQLAQELQIIEDLLYVQGEGHLFALHPRTGKLAWHADLPKIVGVPFMEGFCFGNDGTASIAKAGSIVIVSYELRVIGYDISTRKVLWQMDADSFPDIPCPLVYKDTIYLTGGKNLSLIKPGLSNAEGRPRLPVRR